MTTARNADAKSMERVVNRLDAIEKSMKQSISQTEDVDRLKKSISALQTSNAKLSDEKRHVERSLEEFKNSLSCIVCKCLANFPWMVTPCCQLMLCGACGDRWLSMGSSCPRCRAFIEPGTCDIVQQIHCLHTLLSSQEQA